MAHFDRAVPPGGEGKITLRVKLEGYEGPVSKTADVVCNDARNPRSVLTMTGKVIPLIVARPSRYVQFQGAVGQLRPATVELAANPAPFHILKTEDNLQGKASYKLETVEDGKRYRLIITNEAGEGNYVGFIRLLTDHPQKPELMVRLNGRIEGNIAVRPSSVVVGKPQGKDQVQSGKVVIVSNRGDSFQITQMNFDERLLEVQKQPLYGQAGFVLEIKPKLENIPAGVGTETSIQVQTDIPGEKKEIKVRVISR